MKSQKRLYWTYWRRIVTVKLTVDTSGFEQAMNDAVKLPSSIIQDAYKYFVDTTPIKSGYAKSNTVLQGDTIIADYPYAEVLDQGRRMTSRGMRGSTQAPNGMTEPTLEYIQSVAEQQVNKIGK